MITLITTLFKMIKNNINKSKLIIALIFITPIDIIFSLFIQWHNDWIAFIGFVFFLLILLMFSIIFKNKYFIPLHVLFAIIFTVLNYKYISSLENRYDQQFDTIRNQSNYNIFSEIYFEEEWTSGGFSSIKAFFIKTFLDTNNLKSSLLNVLPIANIKKISDYSLFKITNNRKIRLYIDSIDSSYWKDEMIDWQLKENIKTNIDSMKSLNCNYIIKYIYDIEAIN